jgi:2-polyprenyl-3-methyl-5-hydroxy-6-metoxy-1,4-benzoquinol methylase
VKKKSEAGYNERLFTGGIRRKLHSARFEWLVKSLLHLRCKYQTVLELGCYDGKVIDYLPERPTRYLGLDANWEGGLDIAHNKWRNQKNYVFRECSTPEEMGIGGEQYDISICMETLEHIPPQIVTPYLEELAKATNGYIFVTVPNEIGIVFLFKHVMKRLFGDAESYTFSEFINETLGNTDKVKRREHKGFNYNKLVLQISDYFEIVEVSGHPFAFAPASLNFGIGVIGKSKYYSIQ